MSKHQLKISDYQQKRDISISEHQVLEYWDKHQSFEKSVQLRPENKPYIFYDGPPFATGTPHYGHILVSTIKDVFPRFWTMKGYRVERVWGWDCHGLPIENIVEKELDLKGGKKGIEALGIDKFNNACRAAIWKFDQEWERVIRRIGRWVDFKNSYKTMDTNYMESVWWGFKQMYEKGHVYEGRKVVLYCSRCATPLSNFEIAMDNSYKDVQDHSITVKFKVKNQPNEYLLAWTTTPWTLIGNVGLAVHPDYKYVKAKQGKQIFYLAQDRVETVLGDNYEILDTFSGSKLSQLEYEPLYPYLNIGDKKAFYVAEADFVSLDEGTGIVHTAAMYGEDDFNLAIKIDLPLVPMLDDQGKYLDFVTPLQGVYYKKAESWVIEDLTSRSLLYKTDKIVHSVAHCYRCNTQLFYNAVPAWFINVQQLKSDLITQNEHINWYPDHLKYGRFGKGLETAPDWNISRSRYWGTPMPIWKGVKTGQLRVIGSREELRKWAVEPSSLPSLDDLHREFIDDIEVWVDDQKTEKGHRILEVFDCWVESGSMPYASVHYPFENKQKFDKSYPAQFITEYIAQTRAWFYTLHVMSVGLFGTQAFENALTTGNIQAEDGQKMSKSKKNYPDPEPLMEKYGVDALRFYLMSSSVMRAENTNFSEQGVKETYQKLLNILWNTFSFYKLFCDGPINQSPESSHILDKWIISRTNSLIKEVTQSLNEYDTITSCRVIQEFVTDLSTWYLRRSRDRLRTNQASQATFGWVLDRLIRVMAPLIPFMTEIMYQNLHQTDESIHLTDWPEYHELEIDSKLEENMTLVRKVVESLHALRQKLGIKTRQPLAAWSVDQTHGTLLKNQLQLLQLIAEETNIKNYVPFTTDWYQPNVPTNTIEKHQSDSGTKLGPLKVFIDAEITPNLQAEGEARELVRQIQQERKKMKVDIDAQIEVMLPDWPSSHTGYIKEKTLATTLKKSKTFKIKPAHN